MMQNILESDRLLIREWQLDDAPALYAICLDPELRRNGIGFYDNIPESREQIRLWKEHNEMKAIIRKADNRVIGLTGLCDMNRHSRHKELELAIAAEYRKQGYATEALRLILAHAFEELNLLVVAGWIRAHNIACAQLMEKCGFCHEGTLRRHARDQGDTLCYSMLREEWKGRSS